MTRAEDALEDWTDWRRMRARDSNSSAMISQPSAIAGILLTLVLCGCGAARPSKYYQLTVPGTKSAAQAGDPLPCTLLVGPLLASHLYREDRIVYSSSGEQMGTYEYQRWAEPPTEMVQEVLLRALRSSGRFRAVYLQRSNINGDFLLRLVRILLAS